MGTKLLNFYHIIIIIFTAVITISLSASQSLHLKHKIVKTNSGTVRGLLNYTLLLAEPYYSFRGIRFAEPPVGELRFKVKQ